MKNVFACFSTHRAELKWISDPKFPLKVRDIVFKTEIAPSAGRNFFLLGRFSLRFRYRGSLLTFYHILLKLLYVIFDSSFLIKYLHLVRKINLYRSAHTARCFSTTRNDFVEFLTLLLLQTCMWFIYFSCRGKISSYVMSPAIEYYRCSPW